MEIHIPLHSGLALRIVDAMEHRTAYPTSTLQRGLVLLDGGEELAEEAVGFGVPVLKRGLRAIFAGSGTLEAVQTGPIWQIHARFHLNLVERISKKGKGIIENQWLYSTQNVLAAALRDIPPLRGLLMAASNGLRKAFRWETQYAAWGRTVEIDVRYRVDAPAGTVAIEMETGGLPADITEVGLMDEQGARYFDHYGDSNGAALEGDRIGTWDPVTASEAWFESRLRRVRFRVGQAAGARLYRGRELVGSRLAWAGFGHSCAPAAGPVRYMLSIERRP